MKAELEDLIDDFLEYLFSIRGYSEKTVETYEVALEQMKEYCECTEDNGVVTLDIRSLRSTIADSSKKTISKKLSAIRSFVSYLNEQRDLSVSLKGDTPVRVPKTLPKPISSDIISEVMADCDLMERTVLLILYGMGLRIAELSTLKREDITDRWITVTGKGNKSRQLPLIEEVKNSIDKYLDNHPVGRYLFEKGGVPMNPSQLRYIVTKVFKRHGIKATPHQLRHSFASHLLNNGARISDVSELLGHASMSTTQIYTKLGDAKKLKEYIMAHPLARDD